MQHRERRTILVRRKIKLKTRIRFCVQYSDGHLHFWWLRTWIRYRYRSASDVMIWGAIRYITRTSLLQIYCNLKADWYISDILLPVVVSYLRDLPNAIFQQDNARSYVAHNFLTFLNTSDIRMLLSLQGLQICPSLKTSGHCLLRD
ncbi:hypothetical protein HNY73_013629 [Argiope bruennichi]|uniref:Uncharacterized protein n=1 Tax=Argiope bruennichi TaxID=94029 RepID=A0A8T0F4Q0_ARGBR|nr:hypothetical protein HNY73_013629 [Argiope bruennichi]